MADSAVPGDAAASAAPRERVSLSRSLWRLTTGTVASCMRYRVTGLAAEAAFFALLSLPPLVLSVVASLGYFADRAGDQAVARVTETIVTYARKALTEDAIKDIVIPTIAKAQEQSSTILSISFLLALWSGSRALNVYVDTITIMYGLGGRRGIVRTRALSFTLYVVALVLGTIGIPLVLVGPEVIGRLLPESLDVLNALYWPIVILVSIAFLTSLYHLSVPVRSAWRSDLPGAALALLIWILGAVALRASLSAAVGGSTLYGSLTAPIAVLLWLYITALAVLIGAALNAEIDKAFPAEQTGRARRANEVEAIADARATVEAAEQGERGALARLMGRWRKSS